MAVGVKFDCFVEHVAEAVHNLATDTLKFALTNTAPSLSNTLFADIVEIAAGNGYNAGGAVAVQVSSAQTAGIYKLVLADTTFTASGGSIGPFRYAVLYNSTPVSPLKPLIAYWDYGSALTTLSGASFTVKPSAINGALQII